MSSCVSYVSDKCMQYLQEMGKERGMLAFFSVSGLTFAFHYENKPIEIYRKFHIQKLKIFRLKNSDIFHISAQNIDSPRRGGSNEYPQSTFLSRNKKNNVYPCKP